MSGGYLKRLAQRSGLVSGHKPASAGTPVSRPGGVEASPASEDAGVEGVGGIASIEHRVQPPQRFSESLTIPVPGATLAVLSSAPDSRPRREPGETDQVWQLPALDDGHSRSSVAPDTSMFDRLVDGSSGPSAAAEPQRHASTETQPPVSRETTKDLSGVNDRQGNDRLAAGQGERPDAVIEKLHGISGLDRPMDAMAADHPSQDEGSVAPADPLALAMEWVMDDPYWRNRSPDSAATNEALAPAEAIPVVAPVRLPIEVPPGELSLRARQAVPPAGPPAATAQGAAEGVQVHIGRVAIEVHQAPPPPVERQAPASSAGSPSSTRSGGLSGSRLRRLYLRGI